MANLHAPAAISTKHSGTSGMVISYNSETDNYTIEQWPEVLEPRPDDATVQLWITEYEEGEMLREQCLSQRQEAYGSIGDQLDMQYWDGVNGTTVWADHVAAVKAAHPKPEG